MKTGTIVERDYSVSNMEKYQNINFLKKLDEITEKDGITILAREIDESESSVKIKARFNSDQWDVCQALDFLSKNGISVKPINDFVILEETTTISCKGKVKKVKKAITIIEEELYGETA